MARPRCVSATAVGVMTGERMTKVLGYQPIQLPFKSQVGKVRVAPALHHDNAIYKVERQAGIFTAMIQLASLHLPFTAACRSHCKRPCSCTKLEMKRRGCVGSQLYWAMWKVESGKWEVPTAMFVRKREQCSALSSGHSWDLTSNFLAPKRHIFSIRVAIFIK